MVRSASLGRDYRLLWTAAASSNLGDGVFFTALPLLAVSLSRDPIALSAVSFGFSAPWLAFALVSGALVDRWDRIKVMWRVDLARCVLTAALSAVVFTGATTIPVLVGFAVALGSAETMFDTASLAAVPTVVGIDPERLTRAGARLEGAGIVANGFAGPPAGAAMFAVAPALPVAINAGSFLVSTLLLRNVSIEHTPVVSCGSTLRHDIFVGLRWLAAQPVLATLAVVVGVMNLGSAAVTTLLVLYIQDEAGVGTFYYGLVLTAAAAGALAGAVLAERHASRIRPTWVLPVAVGAFAAAVIVMAAVPRATVIAGAFALVGLAGAVWNVVTVAMRQQLIPHELLGRVNSAYRLIAYGAMPIGAIGAGVLARVAGLRAPFFVAGVLIAATVPTLSHSLRQPMSVAPSQR